MLRLVHPLLTTALLGASPAFGSLDKCHGTQSEVAPCSLDDCKGKECLDCKWSAWGDYGPCDCSGLQERHRTIAQQNNDCGTPCKGSKVETKTYVFHDSGSPAYVI